MIFMKAKKPVNKKQQVQQSHQIIKTQPFKVEYRDWNYGKCSCFQDFGECFCAYFCTPCYICRVINRADEGCGAIICCGLIPTRTKIRTQRKIKGSVPHDFCSFLFCPHCTLIQMSLESKETAAII